MSLAKLIQGEERRWKGRRFLLARRSSEEFETGGMRDYVFKHADSLSLSNIRRRFSDLQHIPKGRMLFFDIETEGLDFDSPILSIALAHMFHRKFNSAIECLVARNPSEEKAILGYFWDLLEGYDAFFSYNGSSFDIPRIDSRLVQNGLWQGRSLKERINGDHHDLYHLLRHRLGSELTDTKLPTIEKSLFHYTRRGDILSEEIPKAYFEYVYGREATTHEIIANPSLWKEAKEKTLGLGFKPEHEDLPIFQTYTRENYVRLGGGFREEYRPGKVLDRDKTERRMASVIHHNMIDAVSMVAILCYLSTHTEADAVPF